MIIKCHTDGKGSYPNRKFLQEYTEDGSMKGKVHTGTDVMTVGRNCRPACVARVSLSRLRGQWSVRGQSPFINPKAAIEDLYTYLDGISPFIYLGLWATRASHSTATLSPGGTRGLYGLRFMHRLNIFLSHSGPRAGWASFLFLACPNPNLKTHNVKCIYSVLCGIKRKKGRRGRYMVRIYTRCPCFSLAVGLKVGQNEVYFQLGG